MLNVFGSLSDRRGKLLIRQDFENNFSQKAMWHYTGISKDWYKHTAAHKLSVTLLRTKI
jgi:hypothetical protein